MLTKIKRVPSPALVISIIAFIAALGGGAFALATSDNARDRKIAKRVANKQITKRAPGLSVAHAGTADSAQTATQAATATNASHATNADQLGGSPASSYVHGPAEPFHLLSTGNFGICHVAPTVPWQNRSGDPTGYYRDPFGTVHLEGEVTCTGVPGSGYTIFDLPPGYRPDQDQLIPAAEVPGGLAGISINPTAGNVTFGNGANPGANGVISLDGISFRCGPSGQNGCP